MSAPETGGRLRAYTQFLLAVCYFFLARTIATRVAMIVATDVWAPLVAQGLMVLLLLLGYASMGFWLNGQSKPVSEQGLPRRKGWHQEAGLGMAAGWGLAVVCVLPMAFVGGISIAILTGISAWGWFIADAAFFALMALAEEIAYRGYGFQRFVAAVGPVGASLGYALFYAIVQSLLPGASRASFCVALALGWLLSTVYLRTRAIWLSWGLNFAWKASRALLFGLAVNGVSSNSPVILGDPMGPFWITGGGFGLDGTWLTFVVLLLALPIIYRLTADLDYRYNVPVIVGAGIPVDLDAIARKQHEAAMGSSEPALVQIVPVPSAEQQPGKSSESGQRTDRQVL
jgi:membrane protease YdiL (CAAX protease family)